MASSSGALNEELKCSICLDVFTDPVTTPCGHNFCRTCLNKCWTNTQTYCCPFCKETFSKRPELKINTTRGTWDKPSPAPTPPNAISTEGDKPTPAPTLPNAISTEGDKPTPAPTLPNAISTEGDKPTPTPPNTISTEWDKPSPAPTPPNAISTEGDKPTPAPTLPNAISTEGDKPTPAPTLPNAISTEGDKPTPTPPNTISTEWDKPSPAPTPPNAISTEGDKPTPAPTLPNAISTEGDKPTPAPTLPNAISTEGDKPTPTPPNTISTEGDKPTPTLPNAISTEGDKSTPAPTPPNAISTEGDKPTPAPTLPNAISTEGDKPTPAPTLPNAISTEGDKPTPTPPNAISTEGDKPTPTLPNAISTEGDKPTPTPPNAISTEGDKPTPTLPNAISTEGDKPTPTPTPPNAISTEGDKPTPTPPNAISTEGDKPTPAPTSPKKLNLGKSELLSSYCETHLEPHYSVPRLNKHRLINAVENLDYICQKHQRPLELFCRDDQTCVCLSCTEGDHRTHNTVPIEEESQQKNKLVKTKIDVQQMIQDRMNKIEEIQHSVELRKRNTEKKKSTSIRLLTDLIHSFEKCQSELLKMMEEQQKAAEKQAEDLIKELQQEISDMKRRNTEMEQLSHTDDHLHFLQVFSSLYSHPHKNWTEISLDSDVNVLPMNRALTLVKKAHETLNKILSQTVLKCVHKFAVDVTLDPDTAHPCLILSDDGKQVSHGDIEPEKRFDAGLCVLAKEGFSSGRFYYEVQVKGKTEWSLGVARKSINRTGMITLTPEDGYWTVIVKNENQYTVFDNPVVMFPQKGKPKTVGVFVDYEEGLVSFYDVGHRLHIYSFTGQTFTDKLYPYFSPGLYDEGKNSNPLIISAVNKKRINSYRIRKNTF
ncbi:uncharacterized protein [Garra rufa]|uniref:uncharacterized protein n=1 Tax=Garra rufa TaxID=137080 RepID=UPI003CCEB752